MRKQTALLFVLSAIGLAIGFALRSQHARQFASSLAGQVESNLASEYARINQEASRLVSDSMAGKSPAWDQVDHFFVRRDSTGIIAWNRNQHIPGAVEWNRADTLSMLSDSRGEFLVKRWPCKGGEIINILTLRNRYPIANAFLNTTLNPRLFPQRELDIIGPAGAIGEEIQVNGGVLFRLVTGALEVRDSLGSFAALLIGLGLLLAAFYYFARDLQRRLGPEWTLLALLAGLYGIRWGMVKTGIPALFFRLDIFDPKVFASSELNASIGDLFFNGLGLLVLVLYFLRHYPAMHSIRWLLQQHPAVRFLAGSVFLLLALLGLLLSYNFIEVIYHNSTQTLDITQSLSFSWVRVAAFLSVLMGTISAFLFIHITVSVSRHLLFDRVDAFAAALMLAAVLFVAQYTWTGNDNLIPLGAGLIMLPLVRVLNFDRLEFAFSFRLFLYLVFSLTLFSIHHSLAVRAFHTERLNQDQFRYAKDFLTERDVLGEYLLDQARQRIAADPFIQTRMASPFFSRNSIVEKIRRVHINRYFDRYELAITTRSPSDSALSRESSTIRFHRTGYAGIWYSGSSDGDALKRYHVSIPIFYQRPVGYVELDLVLKRLLPDNVFPELLVDNRFSQLYRNRDFSYAIYQDGVLTNSFGDFNYERDFEESWLGNASLYNGGLGIGSFAHVGIEDSDGSVAVVSAPSYSWSTVITNISFWFVLGLVVLFTVQGAFGVVAVVAGQQFAFTARIQLFMFLAFALPMVTVTVTTLTLMARTNEEGTTREFLDRAAGAAERLTTVFSSEEPARLETWAADNASYAKTDISIYAPTGKLLATSQPTLFEDQLLSELLSREAYRKIVLEGERRAVSEEQIGSLRYSCAYAAVLSPNTGKLLAIVSLPFFESATYVQKGQLLVLTNILRVFVIVFLIFTLLSFLAADRLAFPFRFIARSLRQTSFTGVNKPLTWKARDEIGLLVSEYNRMVSNLEESKRALARGEKESAWREMAKQVAHEIKNPLTPMKLTLQQMEKGLLEGTMDPERIRKSVDVLLRQVEILNVIASSFSGFARMPTPAPERAELGKLLGETVNLFANEQQGQISFVPPAIPLWASVDPASFSRAVSNILINALQAKSGERALLVSVSAGQREGAARIEIRDNGKGIPEDLRERIFQPQFTTKESGSGLGLYMARQFVVQAGGRIWFESEEGKGTAFYIEFPLLKQE